MKLGKKLIVFLLAAVMLLTLAACGKGKTLAGVQSAGKLVIATSPDFPPFETLDDSGNVVGIEIEILQAVADKLGVELVIEQMDFDSVLPGVQAGKYDIGVSGITVTEKRLQNADFSDVYFIAAQAIVVMPGSDITCKADLEGQSVSVQTGTTAEEYCMDNGYDVQAFQANNDAASALTTGKVAAWVVDNEVALAFAEDLGLVVLDEYMTTEPYAFAFAKGSDTLVAAVNEALAELMADGTVQAIFDEWGVLYVGPEG